MSLADFDNSNKFLQHDLAPLIAERDDLRAIAIDGGSTSVMTEMDIAQEWDGTETTTADRRALLRQAIGSDQVRILPARNAGKRVFDPNRIVLVPPDEPLVTENPTTE
jgi:hypothetical protein